VADYDIKRSVGHLNFFLQDVTVAVVGFNNLSSFTMRIDTCSISYCIAVAVLCVNTLNNGDLTDLSVLKIIKKFFKILLQSVLIVLSHKKLLSTKKAAKL